MAETEINSTENATKTPSSSSKQLSSSRKMLIICVAAIAVILIATIVGVILIVSNGSRKTPEVYTPVSADTDNLGLTYTLNATAGTCYVAGSATFADADLTLPATSPSGMAVTLVGEKGFKGNTTLKNVVISEGIQSIGYQSFCDCTELTSITIPVSVTKVGYRAFMNCAKLTDIHYGGTMAQWDAIAHLVEWDLDTGSYTIHCTDGDIVKPAES